MMVGAKSAPTITEKPASVSASMMTSALNSYPQSASTTHITVLLNEAVDALNIKPNGIYVDGTFGRGGHSRLMLSRLEQTGRLYAIDRDLAALAEGQTIQDARFNISHLHFSQINLLASNHNLAKVDGILLDLGISSPQIDEGERGFSFRFDAPLDMRMDQTRGKTAPGC